MRNVLISYVARELDTAYKTAATDPSVLTPSAEAIDAAIKRGFVRLDNDIVYDSVDKVMKANSRRVAAEILAPALSGSCALLAFYDSRSRDLRVAVAGDSRAVLGHRGHSGKWVATALSEDQTGGTPSEIKRLRQEHPGEPNVVRNGRILGQLEPSRSFGDAFYKWTKETQEKIKSRFFGRTPHQLLKTPPYVTAEPIITTTKIDPQQGDFLVLATDGLWEMLSNEEVVGLVGQWIESQRSGNLDGNKAWLQSWFGSESKRLPVEKATQTNTEGQRPPIRQQQYDIPGAAERFVVEDKNAATHLVRNAMGGKDRDMVSALLTLPSPYSRRYRYVLRSQCKVFECSDTLTEMMSPSRSSFLVRAPTIAAYRSTTKRALRVNHRSRSCRRGEMPFSWFYECAAIFLAELIRSCFNYSTKGILWFEVSRHGTPVFDGILIRIGSHAIEPMYTEA